MYNGILSDLLFSPDMPGIFLFSHNSSTMSSSPRSHRQTLTPLHRISPFLAHGAQSRRPWRASFDLLPSLTPIVPMLLPTWWTYVRSCVTKSSNFSASSLHFSSLSPHQLIVDTILCLSF